jgi:glycine/D-amino acid oxidase-like deaminating enzyme
MDAIIIGAGVVGAACALSLSDAGLRVLVIDRSTISSGTTSAGEGNILISDKGPGPELTLAQRSRDAWFEVSDRIGGGFELEDKGGLMAWQDSRALRAVSEPVVLRRKNSVRMICENSNRTWPPTSHSESTTHRMGSASRCLPLHRYCEQCAGLAEKFGNVKKYSSFHAMVPTYPYAQAKVSIRHRLW